MPTKLGQTSIHLTPDLKTFFADQVYTIARKQGLDITPQTSGYLASVLSRFTDAKNYLVRQTDHPNPEKEKYSMPTLALMFLETNQSPATEQFFKLLQLGDVALFTSGFFGERIVRNALDMDYYMAMGGMAYERAGVIRESITAENDMNVYFELSSRFKEYVEVFAELSDQSLLSNDKDVLKLYEKWLNKGSFRLARMLAEVGVIANSGEGNASKK